MGCCICTSTCCSSLFLIFDLHCHYDQFSLRFFNVRRTRYVNSVVIVHVECTRGATASTDQTMNTHAQILVLNESEHLDLFLLYASRQRPRKPIPTFCFCSSFHRRAGTSGGALYNDGGVLVVRDCYGSNNTAPFGVSWSFCLLTNAFVVLKRHI